MNYQELVTEQETLREQLHRRMDGDRDLLYLKKYELRDKNNQLVPDIINVTLNKPSVFAANVVSGLQSTSQQVVVESDNKNLDTHYVESFQNAAYNAAGLRLQDQGKPSINAFSNVQLCIRGRTARLVLFRIVNGVLIPDIRQWDARYVFYQYDEEGMVWGAYKTPRDKASIESEYGKVITGKKADVLNVWSRKHNEVWIDKDKQLEQAHSFGFCPVVLCIVPLGYGDILLDEDRMMYEGESIFFMVRGVVPELNRLVTLLQTLNQKQLLGAMKYKSKEGPQAIPPDFPISSEVVSVGEGDLSLIDYGDARQAAGHVYNMMEKAMQEGSLTSIDLGNLQFPLSAVALVEVGEGRDRVFLPRLNTLALINQKTAEMFTKQVIQIGGNVELGVPGHKRTFDTSKLEGEYQTTYKYTIKSPKTDIARLSQADAASRYFDPETVLSETLQVEDWKGIMQKRYYYMAEKVDPNVLNYRIIRNLLELAAKGEKAAAREAQIMAASLGLTLRQIKAGQMQPELPPEAEKTPESVIPLLGEGGKVGGIPSSAVRASQLQKQAPELVGGE